MILGKRKGPAAKRREKKLRGQDGRLTKEREFGLPHYLFENEEMMWKENHYSGFISKDYKPQSR